MPEEVQRPSVVADAAVRHQMPMAGATDYHRLLEPLNYECRGIPSGRSVHILSSVRGYQQDTYRVRSLSDIAVDAL